MSHPNYNRPNGKNYEHKAVAKGMSFVSPPSITGDDASLTRKTALLKAQCLAGQRALEDNAELHQRVVALMCENELLHHRMSGLTGERDALQTHVDQLTMQLFDAAKGASFLDRSLISSAKQMREKIVELKKRLSASENEAQRLAEQYSNEVEASREDLCAEIRRLREELENSQKKAEKMKAQRDDALECLNESRRLRKTAVERAIHRYSAQSVNRLQETSQQLKIAEEAIRTQTETTESTRERLLEAISAAEEHSRATQQRLLQATQREQQQQQELASLTARLSTAMSGLSTAQSQIQTLERDLQVSTSTCDSQRKQLAELETRFASVTQQAESFRAQLEAAQAVAAASTQERALHSEQLGKVNDELERQRQAAADAINSARALSVRLSSAVNAVETQTRRATSAEQRLAEVNAAHECTKSQLALVTRQLQALGTQDSRTEALEAALLDATSIAEKRMVELASLSSGNAALIQQLDESQRELMEARALYNEQTASLALADEKVAHCVAASEITESENRRLALDLERLQEEVRELREANIHLREETQLKTQRVAQLEAADVGVQRQIEALRERVMEMEASARVVEARIREEAQQTYSDAREAAESELASLHARVESLREQNDILYARLHLRGDMARAGSDEAAQLLRLVTLYREEIDIMRNTAAEQSKHSHVPPTTRNSAPVTQPAPDSRSFQVCQEQPPALIRMDQAAPSPPQESQSTVSSEDLFSSQPDGSQSSQSSNPLQIQSSHTWLSQPYFAGAPRGPSKTDDSDEIRQPPTY